MEADEKLVWLGIKTNAAKVNQLTADVSQLKGTVGDWETFQNEVDNATSYSDLRDTLVNNYNWSQEDADAFISRLKNEFNSFPDFQSSVDGFDSYQELQALFDSATTFQADSETQDGQPAAGIRIHESAGTTYAGVSVPPGTTEIFGTRVEVSGQSPVRGARDPVAFGTINVSPGNNIDVSQPVTFSTTVSNPNTFAIDADIALTENESVIRSKTVAFDPSESKSVSFTVTKASFFCARYAIGNSTATIVCWEPVFL